MTRTLIIILLALCGVTLWAQQKKGNGKSHAPKETNGPKKKVLLPATYLGHSRFNGGQIDAASFDSLVQQGFYSFDDAGNEYSVVSFKFTYDERRVYEDSVGNLLFTTDEGSQVYFGNKMDSGILESFPARIKYGDTIYVDQVLVTPKTTSTDTFLAKGMKCYISKAH